MPLPNELKGFSKYSYYRGDTLTFDRYLAEQKSFNRQALANYLTVGGNTGFYLVVNDEELFEQIELMTGARAVYTATVQAAEAEFVPRCISILGEILSNAADRQDDRAFPPKYTESMLRAVKHIPPPTIEGVSPRNVVVTLPDLYEHLGREKHYAAAFHHGALLKSNKENFTNSRANIRSRSYKQTDLFSQNPNARYKYWKALSEGKSSIKYQTGKDSEPVEFPIEGSWAETIQARLDAWARSKPSGAPQWMLLEYGQPKWKPTIQVETPYGVVTNIRSTRNRRQIATFQGGQYSGKASLSVKQDSVASVANIIPGNISGAWVAALSQEWTEILSSVWAAQVDKFNKTSTRVTLDTKASRLRSPITGRFLSPSTAFQTFPTRSSRLVEPFGPKEGPVVPFRNAPISDSEMWESLDILEKTFGDDF